MNGEYKSFAALICVTDTEMQALMRMYKWEKVSARNDEQEYYEAFIEKDGRMERIVAAQQDEYGMTASAVLTMKIINNFKPMYFIMTGVAAGVFNNENEHQLYGDVILANLVWNCSVGKFVKPEDGEITLGNVGFIPRPAYIKTKEWLMPYFREAIKSFENECHVLLGAMASGNSVIANNELIEKQIRYSFRDTAGLDMESYAVMYAVEHAPRPEPAGIIIKSVCDYADSGKDDRFQKFAAYTSCQFTKLLIDNFLPSEMPGGEKQ